MYYWRVRTAINIQLVTNFSGILLKIVFQLSDPKSHITDILWETFQWNPSAYMKNE